VIFSDVAKQDLDEIWAFTEDRWNSEQADRYLRLIDEAAVAAAAGRLPSRSLEFVREGLRKARCVRHFIYFYERPDSIRVARVLHDQMDETLHLL
jgi:toxin ParE1/3/4